MPLLFMTISLSVPILVKAAATAAAPRASMRDRPRIKCSSAYVLPACCARACAASSARPTVCARHDGAIRKRVDLAAGGTHARVVQAQVLERQAVLQQRADRLRAAGVQRVIAACHISE